MALPGEFPGRGLIVFLAFCAILATLVLQGTTPGWLVKKLGVVEDEPTAPAPEEANARAEIADAALHAVKSHLHESGSGEHAGAAAELVEEYEMRSQHANSEDAETMAEHRQARQREATGESTS